VEFEEIDERDLTTEAVCAQTECAMVPVGPIDEEVDTAIPVIPLGMRAYGLTVQSARFVPYPFLRVDELDVFLEEDPSWSDDKWLLVEVDAIGMDQESWLKYGFGSSGGYETLGGQSRAYIRSGSEGVVVAYEVPDVSTIDGLVFQPLWKGPVFELR
jgi:hypothetical protein